MIKIDFPFIRHGIPGPHLGKNLVEILGQKNQKVFWTLDGRFSNRFR